MYDTSLLHDDPGSDGGAASGGSGSTGGSGGQSGSGGFGNASGSGNSGGSGNASGSGGAGNSGGSGNNGGTGGDAGTGGDGGTGGGGAGSGGGDTGGTGGAPSGGTGGGGTGGAGTGGTGGAGTGGTGGGTVMPGDPDLVDDFQDLNPQISVRNGRRGSWYAFGTPTPTIAVVASPPAGAPNSGAIHLTGAALTETGGAGFALNNNNVYNAAAYDRIRFWAKVASGSAQFSVAIPDRYTSPDGDVCAGSGNAQCYDDFSAPVTITSTWAQHEVVFADMEQAGWGNPGPGDALTTSEVFAVQFKAPLGVAIDLYLDQIELIYGPGAGQ